MNTPSRTAFAPSRNTRVAGAIAAAAVTFAVLQGVLSLSDPKVLDPYGVQAKAVAAKQAALAQTPPAKTLQVAQAGEASRPR